MQGRDSPQPSLRQPQAQRLRDLHRLWQGGASLATFSFYEKPFAVAEKLQEALSRLVENALLQARFSALLPIAQAIIDAVEAVLEFSDRVRGEFPASETNQIQARESVSFRSHAEWRDVF